MKNIFLISLLILLGVLFLADILFPFLISFWTGNFWFLFLYIVWIFPIAMGVAIVSATIEIIFNDNE